MKRFSKKTKWIINTTLITVALVTIILFLTASLAPPDKDKMENYLQRDRKDLITVADYFSKLEYNLINVDRSNVENGIIFTGAKTGYQKIDDTEVLYSLRKLLTNRNYVMIGKDNNTVFFKKWNYFEKDRGVAFSINKETVPSVEFLVKYEPLSEDGWYYYEADYEEYRNR